MILCTDVSKISLMSLKSNFHALSSHLGVGARPCPEGFPQVHRPKIKVKIFTQNYVYTETPSDLQHLLLFLLHHHHQLRPLLS